MTFKSVRPCTVIMLIFITSEPNDKMAATFVTQFNIKIRLKEHAISGVGIKFTTAPKQDYFLHVTVCVRVMTEKVPLHFALSAYIYMTWDLYLSNKMWYRFLLVDINSISEQEQYFQNHLQNVGLILLILHLIKAACTRLALIDIVFVFHDFIANN